MCIDSGQRIVQEVHVSLPVDGPGQAHPLLLPSWEVQSLHVHKHWILDNTVKIQRWQKSSYNFTLHTFSPISVASPAGRMSKSGSRAQASSTRWYHVFSFSRPNTMLSWTVAFWIQACWGTYATEPWEDTRQLTDLSVFVSINPQPWIKLARTWAEHLNSDTAASFLCFTEHSRQQRGLSAAHMSHHRD